MAFVTQCGLVTLASIVLALAAVGCTAGPAAYLPYWPFEPPDRTSYETPDKRIAKLRAMADEASRIDEAEQKQIVARLARQFNEEKDSLVRAEIVRTAAAYPHGAAAGLFQTAAADVEAAVRIACCEAMGRRRGPLAIPTLAGTLKRDSDVDVQLAAVRAMARFSDQAAVEALLVALESPDPALQYRAMQSLKTMTSRDYGNDASAWQQYVRSGAPQTASPSPSLAERLRRLF